MIRACVEHSPDRAERVGPAVLSCCARRIAGDQRWRLHLVVTAHIMSHELAEPARGNENRMTSSIIQGRKNAGLAIEGAGRGPAQFNMDLHVGSALG
jgi:hypothetical protein